jgi:phosphoribosylpyrophosphate synthetase
MKSAAGITGGDIVYFEKHRTASGIVHQTPIGKVERRAVIVDDILDTGATLMSACEKLLSAGAEELYICVTHGLFTGQQWQDLWSLSREAYFLYGHSFCLCGDARSEDHCIARLAGVG